jgi:hypothetical protein
MAGVARFLAALLIILVPVPAGAAAKINHVFVIVMENMDGAPNAGQTKGYIYGNSAQARYINGPLRAEASFAMRFRDSLTKETRSQPHYILLEAGTTTFADTTFVCNNEPLKPCPGQATRNWTASTDHLVNQIEATGLTWMTYQGGLDAATTGSCPVRDAGLYATKHNPFVYLADIAGDPPRDDGPRCVTHTRNLARLADDLARGEVANYVFITPNLCDDMHGDPAACPKNPVAGGDAFLAKLVPELLTFAEGRGAVAFLAWDEARKTGYMPFVAVGTGVKRNHESDVEVSHRSVLRTVERIFSLPALPAVSDSNDLSDMFEDGALP